MTFDPSRCRLLLVGKLMARLAPFLSSHGYPIESTESGAEAMAWLGEKSFHLVLHELNLRDVELREFYAGALPAQRNAGYLVMAPPSEAESVVSCLVLGADAYVPLPPDEAELFRVLERHGTAAMQRNSQDPAVRQAEGTKEKLLRAQLESAKEKARELLGQVASLEEQKLAAERRAAAHPKEPVSEGPKVPAGSEVISSADLDELRSKATFIEFLESENDELKKERAELLVRLQQLGQPVDDGDVDAFDEPTSFVVLDASASAGEAVVPAEPAGMLLAEDAEGEDDDDADADDLLVLGDDDDELVVELDGDDDDDGDELELDLGPEEPAPPPPRPTPARAPALMEPPPTLPFDAALESSDEGDDEFDVSTDALLRLADAGLTPSAEGASMEGEVSEADLEALLAEIDDD